eukprot:11395-Rhodomonas_salina.1
MPDSPGRTARGRTMRVQRRDLILKGMVGVVAMAVLLAVSMDGNGIDLTAFVRASQPFVLVSSSTAIAKMLASKQPTTAAVPNVAGGQSLKLQGESKLVRVQRLVAEKKKQRCSEKQVVAFLMLALSSHTISSSHAETPLHTPTDRGISVRRVLDLAEGQGARLDPEDVCGRALDFGRRRPAYGRVPHEGSARGLRGHVRHHLRCEGRCASHAVQAPHRCHQGSSGGDQARWACAQA